MPTSLTATVTHVVFLVFSLAAFTWSILLHARSWPYAPGNGAERMELAAQTSALIGVLAGVISAVVVL